jgi:hypothetical protein
MLATPATRHSYVYGLNSPVLYADPTGQLPPAPPVGPSNPRAFEHAFGQWMQHEALPWLYDVYTESGWGGKYHLDFATVARAYCAGEITAYGHSSDEWERADIIAGRIASCIPAADEWYWSAENKRLFFQSRIVEDLLAAGFERETQYYLQRAAAVLALTLPFGGSGPLGRGSTGRARPLNLREQLAMEEAMSNPAGGLHLRTVSMTDPKWHESEGWQKWAYHVEGIEIHYVYNPLTGQADDFKFK